MAKRTSKTLTPDDAPCKLDEHPFYGLRLDDEQKIFRDAIWNDTNDIVFCNSFAGSGKSLIAVGTANLLVEYKLYDGIVYIVAPVQEGKLGYMPGNSTQKIQEYFAPLMSALYKIGINPEAVVKGADPNAEKYGSGYIELASHVYQRGCNLENKVVIIEEAQNFYIDELLKVLTRVHDSCKTIVIGHSKQCDLYKNPERSGFVSFLEHFKGKERCEICELKTNHRGWVSSWADSIDVSKALVHEKDDENVRVKMIGFNAKEHAIRDTKII